MKIVVNDIAATKDSGGAYSVLLDFLEEVKGYNPNYEWYFLVGDKSLKEKSSNNIHIICLEKIKKSWLRRLWFEFIEGKNYINKLKPDIYISLQNTPTLGVKTKQFVYFHQVLPYQKNVNFNLFNKSERLYAIYQHIGKHIYNTLFKLSSSKIIVQTEWLKNRMKLNIKNDIYVVRPSIKLSNNYKITYKDKGITKFFYPAANHKYKNHDVLYKAVNELNNRGIDNFEVILTIEKNKTDSFSAQIKSVGNISREKVYELMTQSILIFPSYLESFGLPLIEAKKMGTYILAADLEYSRESIGNYSNVEYFNFSDSKFLADIMEDIIRKGITLVNAENEIEKQSSILEIIFGGNNG